MEKAQLLVELQKLENKLIKEVVPQIQDNYAMGVERWNSWVRLTRQFFETQLPNYLESFNAKASARSSVISRRETNIDRFLRLPISFMEAFIKSLIIDIKQDELIIPNAVSDDTVPIQHNTLRKAFIVHGHDDATKLRTARFLEKLGFEAIILHEQANGGKTIIEKLEHFTDVGFGIVLYAPDDVGEEVAKKDQLRSRARQNVVFEHGLLIGKLGRNKVFPLVIDHSVELPGDINGMVYMSDRNWEFDLAKEIKALGFQIDINELI